MYIPFDDLSDDARIWIYTSDRKFTDAEAKQIELAGTQFVHEWTAHQQTLHASFKILHGLFLILAVDEKVNDASGCSIDKSVRFIKEIENRFQVNLFNRLLVAYKHQEEINIKPVKNFVEFYLMSKDKTSIYVFNSPVLLKGELKNKWLISVQDSWVGAKLSITSKT